MKKLLIPFLVLLLPYTAFAAPVSWDFTGGILQPLQSAWASLVKVDHIQATSTTASSTLPLLDTTSTKVSSSLYISSVTSKILKTSAIGLVQGATAGTDYVTGSGTSGNCVQWGATNSLTDAGAPCGSGSSSFGQTVAIDSGNWISATTTNKFGYNAPALGLTYGYGLGGVLFIYGSSTNQSLILGLLAGGNNATTSPTVAGNTIIGYRAGQAITTATQNVAIGVQALQSLTTGNSTTGNNTAVGHGTLTSITTGSENTVLGRAAGSSIGGTSIGNTIIGSFSGTGSGGNAFNYNTIVGSFAGNNITTGASNILLGQYVNAPSVTGTGQLNVGNVLFGTGLYSSQVASAAVVQTGRIGIGTTTPWGQFSINPDNLGSGIPEFVIGSSTATHFIIDGAGRIGISTTSPGSLLSIGGTNAGINITTSTSTFTGVGGINLTTGCYAINGTCIGGGGSQTPWTSDINGGGFSLSNVLNASTTAFSALNGIFTGRTSTTTIKGDGLQSTFNGTINIASTSAIALNIQDQYSSNYFTVNTSSTTGDILDVASSTGTILFNVTQTGNTGIATSSPWRTFDVNGTVGMKGLTTSAGLQAGVLCISANNEIINDSVACLASSKRFKQNIKPIDVGLSELMKFRPVSYEWKPSYNGELQKNPNFNGTQYGLIAEEIQKIDPNLISVEISTSSFDGMPAGTVHGLQEANHWIALLVKSIQEVENQIIQIAVRDDAQEVRITALEKLVADQQKQINKLKK